MASVSLREIYKKYAGGVIAVSDFNIEIKDKEFYYTENDRRSGGDQ